MTRVRLVLIPVLLFSLGQGFAMPPHASGMGPGDRPFKITSAVSCSSTPTAFSGYPLEGHTMPMAFDLQEGDTIVPVEQQGDQIRVEITFPHASRRREAESILRGRPCWLLWEFYASYATPLFAPPAASRCNVLKHQVVEKLKKQSLKQPGSDLYIVKDPKDLPRAMHQLARNLVGDGPIDVSRWTYEDLGPVEGYNVYLCLDQQFPPERKRGFWREIYLGFARYIRELDRQDKACRSQVSTALTPAQEPVPIFISLQSQSPNCANITPDTTDTWLMTPQENVLKDYGYIAVGQCLNLKTEAVQALIAFSAAGCPK